jgi:hypothetical protein
MSSTRGTSSESSTVTSLAEAITQIDTKYDSRACPHDSCHGSLSVVEINSEDVVLCQSCRCDVDGEYHPPHNDNTTDTTSEVQIRGDVAYYTHGTLFYPTQPQGSTSKYPYPTESYDGSGKHRLPGGFTEVYDATTDVGAGDEYEYDLSTL